MVTDEERGVERIVGLSFSWFLQVKDVGRSFLHVRMEDRLRFEEIFFKSLGERSAGGGGSRVAAGKSRIARLT